MCRNIKTLHNFEPPATDEEVYAAALQYVRKVSGSTKPSKANEEVFLRAVDEVAHITTLLLEGPRHRRAPARPRGRGREGARPGGEAIRSGCLTYAVDERRVLVRQVPQVGLRVDRAARDPLRSSRWA